MDSPTYEFNFKRVSHVYLTPDLHLIVAGINIQVIDTVTGSCITTFYKHSHADRFIKILFNNKLVVSCDSNGTLYAWNRFNGDIAVSRKRDVRNFLIHNDILIVLRADGLYTYNINTRHINHDNSDHEIAKVKMKINTISDCIYKDTIITSDGLIIYKIDIHTLQVILMAFTSYDIANIYNNMLICKLYSHYLLCYIIIIYNIEDFTELYKFESSSYLYKDGKILFNSPIDYMTNILDLDTLNNNKLRLNQTILDHYKNTLITYIIYVSSTVNWVNDNTGDIEFSVPGNYISHSNEKIAIYYENKIYIYDINTKKIILELFSSISSALAACTMKIYFKDNTLVVLNNRYDSDKIQIYHTYTSGSNTKPASRLLCSDS